MATHKTIFAMRRVLREERNILGLTQESLAEKAGIGMSTVKAAEHGRTGAGFVTMETLLKLIDALDLTPLDYWERVEEMSQ
jgi:transcriptional regulator with XRE-family HTH domain